MNLKHLTDKTLLTDTKFLVSKEREYLTKILHHLREIDRRKLYSDLGYSSLFDYCLKELGYSEGSAQRRIQVSRLLVTLPEIEEKIESGALNLTNVAKVVQYFNEFSIDKRSEKLHILNKMENISTRQVEKTLFEISGEERTVKGKTKRISRDKIEVSIVLDEFAEGKIESVKCLSRINFFNQELIVFMADITLRYLEKKKFKILNTPKVSPPAPAVTKSISSATKREVYLRDKKCVKCGSIRNLNFDHQFPFALGGRSDSNNIRLLCFNCNQRARIRARL